ncbi:MAG: transcriptional regulator [Paracoccaceae bacterium]|jgi:transcriptional regulator
MHPNPVYHTASDAENTAFARDRAFGVLAVASDGPPMISHVPFLLTDDGKTVDLHLVRSNPIVRALKSPLPARLVISGPDSYVSPDWYGVQDQVPTWNYVAVHLTGTLELRPQDELRDLLDRQSALFETQLLPKTPWTTGKMDADALAKMMRMIVPCRMQVTGVDGTWKLSQNKPDDARQRAAEHMDGHGIGAGFRALAALMRGA